MNSYTDRHSGKTYTSKEIEVLTAKAKKQKRLKNIERYDAPTCERCFELWVNKDIEPLDEMQYKILDCSHIKSVQNCKNYSDIELIFSLENMEILCRHHHVEHENNQKSLYFRK